MTNLISILSNFNIIGSAVGVSVGLVTDSVLKSITDDVILPLLSLFITKGELVNKVIKVGRAELKIGKMIGHLIYFFLVISIIVFILKYPLGKLVQDVIDNKDSMRKEGIHYDKKIEEHLNKIRSFNVPI